ncbi:MACO1-like protein [Mya arenaria]|uniref:Macoilin n=1 Tax=Mya arenaria TaxID=6604 RepID=A0ABY7EHT3_MYAAR|nr:MACO1-like protein [Mya arenaria]
MSGLAREQLQLFLNISGKTKVVRVNEELCLFQKGASKHEDKVGSVPYFLFLLVSSENKHLGCWMLDLNRSSVFLNVSTFLYMKFLMVWALVLMADFILEFRFEYLWPFWLLMRSVYDSFKFQGLAFSVFFVSIAITSDVRKQKDVQKDNEFYIKLIQQALPPELQNVEKQKALPAKSEEEGISVLPIDEKSSTSSADKTAANTVTQSTSKNNIRKRCKTPQNRPTIKSEQRGRAKIPDQRVYTQREKHTKDKETISSLERKVNEEKKSKGSIEQQLNAERKAKKAEDAAAARAG